MRAFWRSISSALVVCVSLLVWLAAARPGNGQNDKPVSLTGAWTLNKDLSDSPRNQAGDGREDGDRGRRSGGGRGVGRGGFGGGRGGRGSGRNGSDPEQVARARTETRDIMNPSGHLTIVQTDSMIIITGSEGRTTRLSPDGKKVKDESTKLEWKTKWDGAKLVSEITGLRSGKIIETYSVDPEHRQLHLAIQLDDSRRPLTVNRVYDFDTH
jgi:hypothetical protein